MKRTFAVLFFLGFMTFTVVVRAQTDTIISTKLGDSAGNLYSGIVLLQPTLSSGLPTSYQRSGGGATTSAMIQAMASSGAFSVVVPDTTATNPVNICFKLVVPNLTLGYTCLQPHTIANNTSDWCQSGVCNLDNYPPNLAAQVTVETGPAGPAGPAGSTISIPVSVTNGGTGATTAAGALANLGGLPLSGGTLTGPLNLPELEGTLYADQFQTPAGTGNNGIEKALTDCTALAYPCTLEAPSLYSQTDVQPFGGAPNLLAPPIIAGPTSAQPVAGFLDERYGVPQWIFNSSQPLTGGAYTGRFNATPGFTMTNILGPGQGLSAHYAGALQLQNFAFANGRNDYNNQAGYGDKVNFNTLALTSYRYTQAQGGGDLSQAVNCMGNGDCVGHVLDAITYGGPNMISDEGTEPMRFSAIEGGQVFGATVATITTAADGSDTFTTTAQTYNGYQGEGRLLIDLTSSYNGAVYGNYIASVGASGGNTLWTCGGTCNWDSFFGDSTLTTLTALVGNGASTTNTFPQSNVVLSVASSAGFAPGKLACIFDYDYECELITAVGAGSVTIATDRLPHLVGAYVTTGGLAGYSLEMEADRVVPGNTNGITSPGDSGLVSTVRNVIPIMYNSSGNTLTTMQGGSTLPGVYGGYTGRAYTSMAGSGGTATATLTSGAISSCTATGGTGYINQNLPPQLVITGITYTTAPLIAVTGVSGGALTACTVETPGTGVAGTPVVSVVTSNPYDLYATTKVTGVYDAVAGSVDGTLYTEPTAGSFSTSDLIEEPHYFWQHVRGSNNVVGAYIPSLANAAGAGYSLTLDGLWHGNDMALQITNSAKPTVYSGYPFSTPWILGTGQISTPYGFYLHGPFSSGYSMDTPPFGGVESAVYVRNNFAQTWTVPFYMFATQGYNGTSTVQDGLTYNPSTRAWVLTGGSFVPPFTIPANLYSSGPSYFGVGSSGTYDSLSIAGNSGGTPSISYCVGVSSAITGCGHGYGSTMIFAPSGVQITSTNGAFQSPIFSSYDGIGEMFGNTGALGVAISSSSKIPQIGFTNPGLTLGVVSPITPSLSTSVSVGTLTPTTTYYYVVLGVVNGSTNSVLSTEASFAASATGSIALNEIGQIGIQTYSICRGTSSGNDTTLVATGLGLAPTGNNFFFTDTGYNLGTCPTAGTGTYGNVPTFSGSFTSGDAVVASTSVGGLPVFVDTGIKSPYPSIQTTTTYISGVTGGTSQTGYMSMNNYYGTPGWIFSAPISSSSWYQSEIHGDTAGNVDFEQCPASISTLSSTLTGCHLTFALGINTSNITNGYYSKLTPGTQAGSAVFNLPIVNSGFAYSSASVTSGHMLVAGASSTSTNPLSIIDGGPAPVLILAGAPTYTPGTSVTSCAQTSGYTNSNTRGEITIVGGTATTGTICTVNFSATLSSAPGLCQVTQNGGATAFSLGHGTPSTTSFAVTAAITVSGQTLTADYVCTP